MTITRSDGRLWDEVRPIQITPSFQLSADGSALIETGNTKVLCAASVEEQVPAFLKGSGKGGSLRNMTCYLELLALDPQEIELAAGLTVDHKRFNA